MIVILLAKVSLTISIPGETIPRRSVLGRILSHHDQVSLKARVASAYRLFALIQLIPGNLRVKPESEQPPVSIRAAL
ncbi:MAG: hypothetical protein AAFZ38_09015 [Myxococcota bacterium]